MFEICLLWTLFFMFYWFLKFISKEICFAFKGKRKERTKLVKHEIEERRILYKSNGIVYFKQKKFY